MKKRGKFKLKTRWCGVKRLKLPKFLWIRQIVGKIQIHPKLKFFIFHRKRYWLSVVILIVLATSAWYLSQSWLVRASFLSIETYPKASVMGVNVGGLSVGQLNDKLAKLKSDLETKPITFVNGKDQWAFSSADLGVSFDVNSTSQAVLRLNSLNLIDRYKLLIGGGDSVIEPAISIDNDKCLKSMTSITIAPTDPKDAYLLFDQESKIAPDQPGAKFNPGLTCNDLPKTIRTDASTINVSFDVIPANITKADLEQKLPAVQALIGQPLSLTNGAYNKTLAPDQLLAMLTISKSDAGVQVNWSPAKLDELANNIATDVNTYNSAPALGACQYVISSGGNWSDKDATKKIITDLGDGKPRSYSLPVAYHGSAVGTRKPVAPGNKTIYLTYDDGMTYADTIMNYAACYGVKVTFFEIGERAAGSDAPALRRAIAEGHAVQSHAHYHAAYDYGTRSYDWQYNDISQSITDIMSITGVRPTYFRPPGGNHSANTASAAAANNIRMILWDDSSRDATVGGISSAETCANVLAGAYNGASVLMHSTHYSTAEAMPCIVEGLAARGYDMQALR